MNRSVLLKYILIALFVSPISFIGQDLPEKENKHVDSLQKLLASLPSSSDSLRSEILIELTELLPKEKTEWINYQLKKISEKNLSIYKPSHRLNRFYKENLSFAVNNLGYLADEKGQMDLSISYFSLAAKLSNDVGDTNGYGIALINIGTIYESKGNLNKSIDYFKRGLTVLKPLKNRNGYAAGLINLGHVMENKGDIALALKYYSEAIRIMEQQKNRDGVYATMINMGKIYYDQGDHNKALAMYREVCFRAKKEENINKIVSSLIRIGYYHKDLALRGNKNAEDSALSYFREAYAFAKSIEDINAEAQCLNNIGYIIGHRKDYSGALTYYNQSLQLRLISGNGPAEADLYNNIGYTYMKLGQRGKAEAYLKKALNMNTQFGRVESIKNIAYNLYLLSQQNKDPRSALEFFEKYIKMKDSLANELNKKASIRSQLKYEYEKQAAADSVAHAKESEIKNAELKKQEAEIKARKNQQYALFGGLALVIVFAGFMYNRFKVTQKQKGIIEEQKMEVEEQKKLVEEKQKEILDSIHYAKRIQLAQIPNEKRVVKLLEHLRRE